MHHIRARSKVHRDVICGNYYVLETYRTFRDIF